MSSIQVPFGDLAKNYIQNKHMVDPAIAQVLESGWFVLGDTLRQFEDSFAKYCGTQYGIGVGSGTEALHLALLACGLKPGDEVITVANTCVPTLSAISFAGCKPILVDINPATQTMDPSKIEERISSKTKAILPVHLYGQCAEIDSIVEIANHNGLKVIEDCAQAHGARFKGEIAGSFGDAGCYSFYPSKNLGAYGDGGMVVTRDPSIAKNISSLRNYGQTKRYFHEKKGFNSRLDDLQAAILLAKLPLLEDSIKRRRKIAYGYLDAFKNIDWLTKPHENQECDHAFHLFVVRVPERDLFQEHLSGLGISSLIHYPIPIHRQTSYRECLPQEKYLSTTDIQSHQILSLPLYPEMADSQVSQVIDAVISWKP